MSIRRSVLAAVMTGAVVAGVLVVLDADEVERSEDPATAIPTDPAIETGVLANGMRWYVRHNGRPGDQVQLRLAVDAGSVHERDGAAGAAHYLEHMAFNGTERFPANELTDVLARSGADFGAHVNAVTTFDETVYRLNLPADDESVGLGLEVLAQWASAITLDPDDVDAERGVVLEEWRSRLTGDAAAGEALTDTAVAGSVYEDHDPIGTEASIRSMTAKDLRSFYDTWYRPERMAVVVVGDIDPDEVADEIADRFATLAARAPAVDDPRPDVVTPRPRSVARSASATASGVTASLLWEIPDAGSTVASWTDDWARFMALEVVVDRLDADLRAGELAATGAGTAVFDLVRPLRLGGVSLSGASGSARPLVTALVTEIERARRFGLRNDELERVRDEMATYVEQRLAEADTLQDHEHADAIVDLHLGGTPVTDPDVEHDIDRAIVAGLTTADVEAALDALVSRPPDVAQVSGITDADVPPADEVLAVLDGASELMLEPRAPSEDLGDLEFEAPAAVRGQRSDGPARSTRIEWPNGAVAYVLESDIDGGRVGLWASSAGGISVYDDVATVTAAEIMPSVISQSGVGDVSSTDLDRMLADADVALTPWIDLESEGLSGTAAAGDVEVLLGWAHTLMTAPRVEAPALERVRAPLLERARHPTRRFDDAIYSTLSAALAPGSIHGGFLPDPDALAAVTVDDVARVAQDRFGDAGGWVFVVVGDVDASDLGRSLDRWVGTLPGSGRDDVVGDVFVPFPTSTVVRDVTTAEARASITRVSGTVTNVSPVLAVLGEVTREVVEDRLLAVVREDLGASYAPVVGIQSVPWPTEWMSLFVQVEVDPDRVEEVTAVLDRELASLATDGPTGAELTRALSTLGQAYDFVDNGFYLMDLAAAERDPDDAFGEPWRRAQLLDTIGAAQVRSMLDLLVTNTGAVEVRVLPGASG